MQQTSDRRQDSNLSCIVEVRRYLPDEVENVLRMLATLHRTRLDKHKRRHELTAALKQQGMSLKVDSSFCTDYIEGRVDVDIQEVVSVMFIAMCLFEEGGCRAFSEYSGEMTLLIRVCVQDKTAAMHCDRA